MKLWEWSQVTFPANDLRSITCVKSAAQHEALADVLREICAALKTAGTAPADPAEAATQALLADLKSALGHVEPRTTTPEPAQSTRANRAVVAELRREMEAILTA